MLYPTEKYRGFYYQVVYSSDDGGYYAEVLNARMETLKITELVEDQESAGSLAETFIDGRLSHGKAQGINRTDPKNV